jgi:hypothetical protein
MGQHVRKATRGTEGRSQRVLAVRVDYRCQHGKMQHLEVRECEHYNQLVALPGRAEVPLTGKEFPGGDERTLCVFHVCEYRHAPYVVRGTVWC